MTRRRKVYSVTVTALFAALIVLCTWLSVPAAVPFTMQTFAVLLAVGLLGTKRGLTAIFIYIALGAVGLPVFSGFRGGIGVLFGNTGGYILGFVFGAGVCGLLIRCFGKSVPALIFSMATCVAVCYLFGSLWYFLLYTHTTGAIGFGAVLLQCVIPFLAGDVLKIALAVILTRKLSNLWKA